MHIKNFRKAISELKPFLREYLEGHGIDTSSTFSCIDPSHEDENPSCTLFGEGANLRATCFGCQGSFDIFDAAVLIEGKPRSGKAWVTDTLGYLAKKFGVKLDIGDVTDDDVYEMETYRAYRAATGLLKFYDLDKSPILEKAHREVTRRGWSPDTLRYYGVGVIEDFDSFRKALQAKGFSLEFLREVDLLRRDIFNPGNLIFTWRDEHGRPVGFTARNLNYDSEMKVYEEERRKNGKARKPRRYNNLRVSTGRRCGIFKKNSRLFGIDSAISSSPPLYIFEGQADVITAKQAGLLNCCCFGGGKLSMDQIYLVRELGIFDVVVCMDGDGSGVKKTEDILSKLSGHRDMSVRVISLPEGEDPDSFIRENGLDAFEKLAKRSSFEWRLYRYDEDDDEEKICKEMIPFIVSEPSPVTRERLCNVLSARTGVSSDAIAEEVSISLDAKSYEASRERAALIDKVIHDLRTRPSQAEEVVQHAAMSLAEINSRHFVDSFSADDFLRHLLSQKETEEEKKDEYEGFRLGPDLAAVENTLQGDWTRDVVIYYGGKPNHGKTALLTKIAYEIAGHAGDDTVVIYHSIDDTREQLIPRLVAVADGSTRLEMNAVSNPNYWATRYPAFAEEIRGRRAAGYNRIVGLAREGRLVVKDINNGGSMAFIEGLLSYYTKRYKRVAYFLDNFHKLNDYNHISDARVKWRTLSQRMKELAERYHVSVNATVEYHKIPPGERPTNYNIGETNQIHYDANAIFHIYNEMADVPDSCTHFHSWEHPFSGEKLALPTVEVLVGKNKIASLKDPFLLDFWPSSSDYRFVDNKSVVMGNSEEKDPFMGAFS